jgi:hypothetical protein
MGAGAGPGKRMAGGSDWRRDRDPSRISGIRPHPSGLLGKRKPVAPLPRNRDAARAWAGEIEESMRFIGKNNRFTYQADRALALGRFEEGRRQYARLAEQAGSSDPQ